jgi:hypothetical protein
MRSYLGIRHEGIHGCGVKLLSFLNSVIDGGKISASLSGPFIPRKEPSLLLNRRQPVLQVWSGSFRKEKSSFLVEFRSTGPRLFSQKPNYFTD